MTSIYLGDNLIPGVTGENLIKTTKPISNAIGGLINAAGDAYGAYGKNLRQSLGQEESQYIQDFLNQPVRQKRQKGSADLRGSVTPGSSQAAASNLGEGAAMDAAERFRKGAGYPSGITRPGDYPVSSGEVEDTPDSN